MARAVAHTGEHQQRRPAPDRDRAQRHQRLPDRADGVAAGEEGRVRELHELEAESGVFGDHALELLERRRLALREQRQRAEPVGRSRGAGDDDGLGEVLALEGVEAQAAAEP